MTKEKSLYELNEEATRYYQSLLKSEENEEVIEYFNKIKTTMDNVKRFRLGYAKTAEKGLLDHLKSLGYSDDRIIDAGLAERNEDGETKDVFRNRLIIPVIDDEDRVIGFSGRSLDEEDPIYLNSRSTDVFDKSKSLFGLNIAKDASADYMVLCEGYMDVITLNQAGFDMAIATLGVKFTVDQANLLKKYTNKVFVCFDTDDVGNKGADSAISIIIENGMKGLKIDLSPFKDPMDMITKESADAFRERLGC